MAKLSNTQQKVLDHVRTQIDVAREHDYPEWLLATIERFKDNEEAYSKAIAVEYLKDIWEIARQGIALTDCSSNTIRALEKRGFIEIVEDACNDRDGIDKVRLLKY